jgi:spore coat protein U-like protein
MNERFHLSKFSLIPMHKSEIPSSSKSRHPAELMFIGSECGYPQILLASLITAETDTMKQELGNLEFNETTRKASDVTGCYRNHVGSTSCMADSTTMSLNHGNYNSRRTSP